MLQFVTNAGAKTPIADQVKGFIAGGGRWVQIRMDGATDEEVESVIKEIKPLCLETETFLLLHNRVELAKTLDVGGVHLEKDGMLPSQARMILGPAAVIGVTAESIDDVKRVKSLDVDYVSLWPYAETGADGEATPPLGLEGIRSICTEMETGEIEKASVASGGIELEDVVRLMETGVNGIAVSRAIAEAEDIEKKTAEFLEKLSPFMKQ